MMDERMIIYKDDVNRTQFVYATKSWEEVKSGNTIEITCVSGLLVCLCFLGVFSVFTSTEN